MTAKEKKEYTILGVLVLAIIIVLYFSFFRGSSEEETPLPASISVDGEAPSFSTELPFLPYGTTLDTKITEDQRLRTMIPPTYPTVDISEVGLSNPFVP